MEKKSGNENPLACPVVATMNLISGKWKPMVLHILSKQPTRFGELKRLMSPISQKVLTQQLKELENDRLILRQVIDGRVLNVTYQLSEFGKSLTPLLELLYQWGEVNLAKK